MILKSLTRKSKSFKQILKYVVQSKDVLYEQEETFVLKHNMGGENIEDWVKSFLENEEGRSTARRKDSVVLYHDVISLNKKDNAHINLALLKDVAQVYLQKRSPYGLGIALPHREDENNPHIHCVISGVTLTGKANRISRVRFGEIKRELEIYIKEKYPKIEHSQVLHAGQNRMSNREYPVKMRDNLALHKERLKLILDEVYEASMSKAEFFRLLKEGGVTEYYRNGLPKGFIFGKRKYRYKTVGFERRRVELEVRHIIERPVDISQSGKEAIVDEQEFQEKDIVDYLLKYVKDKVNGSPEVNEAVMFATELGLEIKEVLSALLEETEAIANDTSLELIATLLPGIAHHEIRKLGELTAIQKSMSKMRER